jgi:D-alanine-D-alanine ligase
MRIGIVYDLFDAYPWRPGDPPDADVEYEPEETVVALEAAIAALGHEPVRLGTPYDLLRNVRHLDVHAAVNIAEAAHTRNREAYAPLLLEMAGIPFLGSDALTLSLSLDKAWTKDLAAAAGVPTPPYRTFRSGDEVKQWWDEGREAEGSERRAKGEQAVSLSPSLPLSLSPFPASFPLFVKPRYEGSAKGITPHSRVDTPEALAAEVDRITRAYRQDALVETFIEGGGEFTVAVIGNDPPDALPVLQRAVETSTRIGLHALERRGLPEQSWDYTLEGRLTPELEAELQDLAVRVYEKLHCKDFARVDFRVDRDGRPWFLEINPLPTFAPDGTFAIIAELMGLSYPDFLSGVLRRGLRRLGLE